ncbi:hypothetical protein A1Q1_07691 [Trichosporon asahii var. asahii CBS 2479]|uniref:ATP synthase F(0) complex subunit e, mitochondrial n=1 Tax=Trichosporon asahii var. asahii (strain ATCC 90039 / CBS 2479 / JCM 2466 / KCTC 7840 / NBRC 103889/ NCYC 2677 / UAMH 7654) TaxID=1186058 RepID=J5TIM7_TRIAS|nr:hypothetical protein A1Q1_07691 [Trichosporon asahii var. asahii CBS 2479]EJT51096.1 hypothetical protein A1Q1_07691 [Trichosporon asahii var. asahii CBS 2479]
MASSNTVNVIRYSALIFGVAYGFLHNRTLHKEAADQGLQNKLHKREELIAEAKRQFAANKAAKQEEKNVITDPSSDKFDLEAAIKHWAGEKA